jgi:hypothetical protein
MKIKVRLAAIILFGVISTSVRADEMNDLMGAIIKASPQENAKMQKFASSKHKVSSSKSSKNTSAEYSVTFPDDQLLEVSSKFPKEFIGKYVYGGPLTFTGIFDDYGSPCISFTAKNNRRFYFYTKDPLVIALFQRTEEGTQFDLAKDMCLKIVSKFGLFTYVLKMPYDNETSIPTVGDKVNSIFKNAGDRIKADIDNTGARIQNDLR